MKKIIIIVILFITLLFFSAFSQENVNEIFGRANKFYTDEKYQEAIDEYIKIIDIGYENGIVYYNLGNAYYKIGNIGKSILYYEKAKKILPTDEDIDNNLKLVNLYIADKITPIPELFYVRYFKNFTKIMSPYSWMKSFLAIYVILCICICARIIIKQQKVKDVLKKSIFLFTFLTLLSLFIFIYSEDELNRHNWAIVMNEKTDVYASPSESSTELFSIHKGTKIKLKRTEGKWIEITLADGKVGWIVKDNIEII